jgi:hypothetical protein
MRYPIIGITLVALASSSAVAQADPGAHMMKTGAAHAMRTTCG